MILLCIAITPLWRWHYIKHVVETMSAITILPLGLGGLLGLYLSAGAVYTIIYIHGLLLATWSPMSCEPWQWHHGGSTTPWGILKTALQRATATEVAWQQLLEVS